MGRILRAVDSTSGAPLDISAKRMEIWMKKPLLERINDIELNGMTKGVPVTTPGVRIGDVNTQGWNPVRGNMQYPVLTMGESRFDNNLTTMLDYSRFYDLSLAPHIKTPMSPQLVPRLLKRGCWGISAATLQQAAVILEAGASHVLLANQIGGREAAKQFSWLQRHFPQSNLYLFVDSIAAVKAFLDW